MDYKFTSKIPVAKPTVSENVLKYVSNAIEEKALSGTFGNYIDRFEDEFAEYLNAKYAISVTNGTCALHIALKAFDIGEGDEVLVQSLTNMATAFSVSYTGANIIPIDSELQTCNIDPSLLEKRINKNTKAIMVVHLFGHPVDMDSVLIIARKYNLIVIEDCAEAHGAKYKGRHLGTIGDIGCYSFYANKILSTGEGGMIVTNNLDVAKRCRSLKSLAYGSKNRFNHSEIGFNYRMSNLTSAVGCAQLEDINYVIQKKRAVANKYNLSLKNISCISIPCEKNYAFNVYWVYHVICKNELQGKRELLMELLKKHNIETRESFWPINRQKVYENLTFGDFDCPVANYIGENGLYLPSGPDITNEEIEKVIGCLQNSVEIIMET